MFTQCVALCLSLAAADPASPLVQSGPPDNADWIALKDNDDGLLRISVTLDGEPATALIDTGSPGVVLSHRWAKSHHKDIHPIGAAISVGGAEAFGTVDRMSLSIGARAFPAGPMQVSKSSALEQALGEPIDVVIGASLIARTGLTVDYDARRVRFLAMPADPTKGAAIALRLDPPATRFSLAPSVSGKPFSNILLDTGSMVAVSLTRAGFAKLDARTTPTTDIAVAGGGGLEIETVLTLPSVQLGSVSTNDVAAQVEPAHGFLEQIGMNGAIGSSYLRAFNFIIDPTRGTLFLLPRRVSFPPQLKSTVGIQGDYTSDRIHVVHIMANSPAQKAGLRDGDEICAVNDQAIVNGWSGSSMRNWGVRAPGSPYRVRLCSGRTVDLVSARFY